MTIKSGSMVASGFNVGDNITVRACDTNTLHEGDKIAFYVYENDYKNFDINHCQRVEDNVIAPNAYTLSFNTFFGLHSKEIIEAAKNGATPVFHHIRAIYEDANGTRWFKTYGTSNGSDDVWFISENMVIGLYDNSTAGLVFSSIIKAVNSQFGFLVLLVPVVLLGLIIVFEAYKNLQRAKLELDCVEQKRKITDPICVKNDIGFGMDTKTKYKILAQANESEHNEYISLLWKKGAIPKNIKKYYMRRDVILGYNRKLCELNRTCEEMFKRGEKPTKIAKFYTVEKQKLMNEQRDMAKKLRAMRNEEQKREYELADNKKDVKVDNTKKELDLAEKSTKDKNNNEASVNKNERSLKKIVVSKKTKVSKSKNAKNQKNK